MIIMMTAMTIIPFFFSLNSMSTRRTHKPKSRCSSLVLKVIILFVWNNSISTVDAKLVIYNCDETNCQPGNPTTDNPKPLVATATTTTNKSETLPPIHAEVTGSLLDLHNMDNDANNDLCNEYEETGIYQSATQRHSPRRDGDDNEEAVTSTTFQFLYELVTDQSTAVSTVKDEIVPMIEKSTSHMILSFLFDECTKSNTPKKEVASSRGDATSGKDRRRNLFLRRRTTTVNRIHQQHHHHHHQQQQQQQQQLLLRRILPAVGMSMFPDDKLRHEECEGKTSHSERCFVIESLTTLQFSSNITSSNEEDIKSMEESLRLMIDSGELHNLHNNLVRVNYRQDQLDNTASLEDKDEQQQQQQDQIDKQQTDANDDVSPSFPYYTLAFIGIFFVFAFIAEGKVCHNYFTKTNKFRQTRSSTFDMNDEMFQDEDDVDDDEHSEHASLAKYLAVNKYYPSASPSIKSCMKVKTWKESLQACNGIANITATTESADQHSLSSESFHSAVESLGDSSGTSYHTATNKIVRFNQIHVRQYKPSWSDNPSVSCGLPIGLSWSYTELESMDVNRYETLFKSRPCRRSELLIPLQRRHDIIQESCGLSTFEISELTYQHWKQVEQNLAAGGSIRALIQTRRLFRKRTGKRTTKGMVKVQNEQQLFWHDAMPVSPPSMPFRPTTTAPPIINKMLISKYQKKKISRNNAFQTTL